MGVVPRSCRDTVSLGRGMVTARVLPLPSCEGSVSVGPKKKKD